ncbi:probable calcium-binding protein CML27 [Juglans microcarpa x Juglans regia]|uniref:probable calcium-binding protein CML27 n=1 Tax=Juglans microcarpa x Juglans regia TaxID=2249226 RepID=UPI001B7E90D1|nr:probable calcium-binding protein CML27 [Juglans microcarpa x Juglans regia]
MSTNPTSNPIESSQKKPSLYLQNMDEVEEVFNRFDTNGDGKISVSELGAVLSSLGTSFTDEGELRRIMAELDSDNDGFISLPEFAAFCRSGSEDGGSSDLQDAFRLYDQDQNGLISATELHLVLNRLGMKCSIEECHRMIRSVDSDGDGNVSFKEFEKMMSNANKSNGSAQ